MNLNFNRNEHWQLIAEVLPLRICLTVIVMILCFSKHAVSEEQCGVSEKYNYGEAVPYEIGKSLCFPEITVLYKGSILESGHEKFTSNVFELTSGQITKTVTIKPLEFYTVVRFGLTFYTLKDAKGYKTIRVNRGFLSALKTTFWLD